MRGHEIAINEGIPLRMFELFRFRSRQSELYAQGRTTPGKIITNAKPGYSFHQYGIAADMVMHINGKWNWTAMEHYKSMVPIMESVGLKGLYKMGDWPHWQLAGTPSIKTLNNIYDQYGLEGVWERLDEQFG